MESIKSFALQWLARTVDDIERDRNPYQPLDPSSLRLIFAVPPQQLGPLLDPPVPLPANATEDERVTLERLLGENKWAQLLIVAPRDIRRVVWRKPLYRITHHTLAEIMVRVARTGS